MLTPLLQYGVYVTDGPNRPKQVVQNLLKELDLPYTIFYAGIFHEFAPMYAALWSSAGLMNVDGLTVYPSLPVCSAFGHKYAEGKMNVVGSGKTAFSLTASRDVGELVAHVVSTATKTDLEWAKIPFEGDRKTPLEIAALAEKKLGKKMELTFIDYEENKKNYLTDFGSYLSTLAADGLAATGTPEEIAAAKAKFFPDWHPTPYEAFIA